MSFPASAKTTTFIITRDRPRAVAFYRDVLGFRQTGEHAFAAIFDLNGVVMQLVTVADHKPSPHTVLGWEVQDIAAEVKALSAKGIKFETYEGDHTNRVPARFEQKVLPFFSNNLAFTAPKR